MAPKKKDEDDVKKAKGEIGKGARAVGKAANRLLGDLHFPDKDYAALNDDDWDATVEDVDSLDNEFETENMLNKIMEKFERGASVRVMQIGPNGALTDVSDKVSPKDLRPEQISGIHTESGTTLTRNPQNREAALKLLQELLPGLRPGLLNPPKGTQSTSIRLMEKALAESDKILEHWKK